MPRDPIVRCEQNLSRDATGRDPSLEHPATCRKPARWVVQPDGRGILHRAFFCKAAHAAAYVAYQAHLGYESQVSPWRSNAH